MQWSHSILQNVPVLSLVTFTCTQGMWVWGEESPLEEKNKASPLILGHFPVASVRDILVESLLCLETPRLVLGGLSALGHTCLRQRAAPQVPHPQPAPASSQLRQQVPFVISGGACWAWLWGMCFLSRHSWPVFSSKHLKLLFLLVPRGTELPVAQRKLWAPCFWIHKEPKDKRNNLFTEEKRWF